MSHLLKDALLAHFTDASQTIREANGECTLEVPPESITAVAQLLRDGEAFQFEQLIDLCAVDYQAYGVAEWQTETVTTTGYSRAVETQEPVNADFERDFNAVDRTKLSGVEGRVGRSSLQSRFAVVYHLLSLTHNHRLRVRCFLPNENALNIPSVVDIWNAANWFEREAFDLFGVVFEGHPDLRRILTDYDFKGHPLRKDFPLIGEVEMRYDAGLERCVYEPVSIQPRVLTPKVIRSQTQAMETAGSPVTQDPPTDEEKV